MLRTAKRFRRLRSFVDVVCSRLRWKPRRCLRLLAFAGCIAGMLFALVIRAALNASGIILPPPPGATHGMPIHVRFYPLAYAAGLVAMVLTMAIASYFPARRASRMSIVEALAHI